jgi:hypothetical protein
MPSPPQVFLLSPASCSGQRARLLFREQAQFHLARQLRSGEGAPLADVFSFLSGLYFRGKATYARAFQRPPPGGEGIYVITASRGLVPADTRVTLADLREFAEVPIDAEEPRYREPLARDAAALAAALTQGRAVLLGSVATGKYSDILAAGLGERLVFPSAFVGRGDMSRGGLMLRAVDEGRELDYVPIAGAVVRGTRPPKLPRR